MTKVTHLPADDRSCGWYHLSPPRRPKPAHYGRSAARWVVVGAGFTGLAAARQLALH
ncbi:FAD-dependent oxidoreductase, partial [Pseudomonas aeruginosa]